MGRFSATTADGRALDVHVAGPNDGLPLVFHNGTPSSGQLYAPFVDAASARGLRMVGFSRPGYGGSTRNPGRSVADVAIDVLAVVDRLGAAGFYTLGWSGGGPHALACGAALPTRVIGVATVGSLAPFGAGDLDWTAGMGDDNVAAFRAALEGEVSLQAFLDAVAPRFATITGDQVAANLRNVVSDVDAAVITGEPASWLAAVFRESVRTGIWGWHDDELAFVRPWGFDLDAIRVPVAIWQGAHDRNTPPAHGRWLASRVPNARPHLLADHGHFSLGVASIGAILDDLLAIAPPPR